MTITCNVVVLGLTPLLALFGAWCVYEWVKDLSRARRYGSEERRARQTQHQLEQLFTEATDRAMKLVARRRRLGDRTTGRRRNR